MAVWNTGPIENNAVSGSRPTVSTTVIIVNESATQSVVVLTQGYNLSGTRALFVLSQDGFCRVRCCRRIIIVILIPLSLYLQSLAEQ